MKLNYEFYKKDYISDISNSIDNDIVVDCLRELKKNILCWYKFKKTDKILQIGFDDEISKMLAEMSDFITIIEPNEEKVKNIYSDYDNLNNIEVILGNLDNIKLMNTYDYIIFIGSFEKLSLYTSSSNPYIDFFNIIKNYISKNTKLIIATDNKFGMRYFAGYSEKSTKNPYTSLVGNFGKNTKLFGKNEIISILKNIGFVNTKFYYPLPNFSAPNIIFSDDYMPTCENIVRYLPLYNREDVVRYSEVLALRETINNSTFDMFANSYLIEASLEEIESGIKFISFNNSRKKEYRLITIMEKEKVYKYNFNSSSIEHYNKMKNNISDIENLNLNQIEKLENDRIVSNFIKDSTLDNILIGYLKGKDIRSAELIINQYIKLLSENLGRTDSIENNIFNELGIVVNKDLSSLVFVKNGYWDMTFQNIFYINNEMYVFDQEWKNDNVPLEFILYRGLKILFIVGGINEETRNEIYSKYNIINFLDIFEELENKFQIIVNDEEIKEAFTYRGVNDVIASLTDEILILRTQINEILIQKELDINTLNSEINRLRENIDSINRKSIKNVIKRFFR